MLRIANLHIGKSAIAGILLAWTLLLAMDAFLALIAEISDLDRGDYTLRDAFTVIALTIPRRAYDLFPTAAVVGTLLGLGALAVSSELVAYRAAGVSRLRIAMAAVLACATLLIPVLAMGEFVAPAAEVRANELKIQAREGDMGLARKSGLWIRSGDTFLNARRPLAADPGREGEVELADITVYETDGEMLVEALYAESGRYMDGQWTLSGVRQSRLGPEQVDSENRDEITLTLDIDPEIVTTAAADPRNLGIRELLPYVEFLQSNDLGDDAYRAALWQRLAYPVAALAMALAGTPFLFGGLRGGGLGQRLFIGMVVGIVFYLVSKASNNLGVVYGLSPPLAALAPALLVAGTAVVFLRRHS